MNKSTLLDDRENELPEFSEICVYCTNHDSFRTCKAFKEIPLEIWLGKYDHKTPYPGDNGIRFELYPKKK